MDALVGALRELGYEVDESFRQQGVAVIKGYPVQAGRHAGQVRDIGVPCPDFPYSAPAGLHISPPLPLNGHSNVSQSPLGAGWQYWSRRLTDWAADRSARHVISYINKVLLDA